MLLALSINYVIFGEFHFLCRAPRILELALGAKVTKLLPYLLCLLTFVRTTVAISEG